MATWMLALAAALSVGIAMTHSYLGERYILIRLFRRADLPKLFGSDQFTKRTIRFAWHITSVAWIALAATLFIDPRVAVSVGFGVSAVVTAIGSRGRHYAWVVFLAIALLAWPW